MHKTKERQKVTKDEYSLKIESIINSEKGFGFEAYACIKKGEKLEGIKFIIEDKDDNSFKNAICDKITQCCKDKYLYEGFDLKQIDDLYDNTNSLFEIPQNETYSPFLFLNNLSDETFNDTDKPYLFGFIFRFNIGKKEFFAYQQVYPVTVPQKKKGTFLYSKNNVYKEFTKELLRIDYRIDLLIIEDSIIAGNIKLLQSKFGFEMFIRNESKSTLDLITKMDIIENMEKLCAFEGKEKLTNAKKLMKIKKSPVLSMDKNILIKNLQTLPRYKEKLTIIDNKIKIRTNKDIEVLLKILNDDYLKSELTGKPYESSNKLLEETTA